MESLTLVGPSSGAEPISSRRLRRLISLPKQFKLLQVILAFYHFAYRAISLGVELDDLVALPVRTEISRAKGIPEDSLGEIDELKERVRASIDSLKPSGEKS